MSFEERIIASLTTIDAKVTDIRSELGETKRDVAGLSWRVDSFTRLHGSLGAEVSALRDRVERLEERVGVSPMLP